MDLGFLLMKFQTSYKTGQRYKADDDNSYLTDNQLESIMITYYVDAVVVSFILIWCFWIVLRYVCFSKEKKLGFIYLFYSFAIILCSMRIAQSVLVIYNEGSTLKANQPDDFTGVNLLNNICNALTYLFGCVIVYNTFLLQQKL